MTATQNIPSQQAMPAGFSCQIVQPERRMPTLLEDVQAGLLRPPRSLPPKYFYDSAGSQLFDQICDTAEYYVTRTEDALLASQAHDIIRLARPENIIEIGSGTSRKTVHLLNACQQQERMITYWPFDVCEDILRQAAESLMPAYPWLSVNALAGDYLAGLKHLASPPGRNMYVFLGSTIGNFTPDEARAFLTELRTHMQDGDYLLLGADRVKPVDVLEAAYNDAQGVTAAFNLNLLRVLNRELQGDFDLAGFRHQAVFNQAEQQIEMYLISERSQQVELKALNALLKFARDEVILTEISRKFTPEKLQGLLGDSGFAVDASYEPGNGYFSLLLCKPE